MLREKSRAPKVWKAALTLRSKRSFFLVKVAEARPRCATRHTTRSASCQAFRFCPFAGGPCGPNPSQFVASFSRSFCDVPDRQPRHRTSRLSWWRTHDSLLMSSTTELAILISADSVCSSSWSRPDCFTVFFFAFVTNSFGQAIYNNHA